MTIKEVNRMINLDSFILSLEGDLNKTNHLKLTGVERTEAVKQLGIAIKERQPLLKAWLALDLEGDII